MLIASKLNIFVCDLSNRRCQISIMRPNISYDVVTDLVGLEKPKVSKSPPEVLCEGQA